jgi:hypothetical protein
MITGVEAVFLEFVAGYVASKAIDAMGTVSRTRLDSALDTLEKNPRNAAWSEDELQDNQIHFGLTPLR